MNRRFDLIAYALMGVAVALALAQWIAVWQGSVLPSAFEFIQSWVLITAAILFVGYLAVRQSRGVADAIGKVVTLRTNLPIPVTILAYLSTEWFAEFHEKYNVPAWHTGLALKGFWLGTIAQSHPSPANPFPNVHYSFWANLLQWMVDHSVYSWFGYVVIAGELLIAVAFITAALGLVSRPMLAVAGAGSLLALLFHFWFLMSGSAGVNALMPYLTGIAAVCLIGSWVAASSPEAEAVQPIVLEPIAVAIEKVPSNGKASPREPVASR